jgi:hypothetical protein
VVIRKGRQSLDVTVEYRRPVVFVPLNNKQGVYLDGNGVVLPPEQATEESLRSCLAFEGAEISFLPQAGAVVEDAPSQAAAKLASELAPVKAKLGLVKMKLDRTGSESFAFKLTDRPGNQIWWRGSDTDSKIVARIVQSLLDYQTSYGALEKPAGPYAFDFTVTDGPETRKL